MTADLFPKTPLKKSCSERLILERLNKNNRNPTNRSQIQADYYLNVHNTHITFGFRGKDPFTWCDVFLVRLRFYTLHGMGCMDVSDTVHTVRLRFD